MIDKYFYIIFEHDKPIEVASCVDYPQVPKGTRLVIFDMNVLLKEEMLKRVDEDEFPEELRDKTKSAINLFFR
ncbi:MAG: hypothetical protein E6R03_17735 [Hyphomicrobiaceae bacterium]|nr:MAG: hypothetical protein E6R03_17735 [Hyphomicrobiaceae bacterium]